MLNSECRYASAPWPSGLLMSATASEGFDKLADDGFGVAEKHIGAVAVVQLVLNAGKPGVHAAFDCKTGAGLVGVDDRHAVNWAGLVVAGGRIDDVVGADYQHDVGLRHIVVDVVHLDEFVVGDFRLGQQDVHVPRHASGNRMNGKTHIDALFGQEVV